MTRRYAWHPVLVAAFPVLFLWAQNRGEVRFGDVAGPLLLVTGTTAATFLGASLVLRDHRRGALVASGWAFLALSYGHVWDLVGAALRSHVILLAGWLLLAAAVAGGAVRARDRLGDATNALNVVALALVVTTAAPLAPLVLSSSSDRPVTPSAAGPSELSADVSGRDIFYIVPDRYPRADNLRELFGADNGPFLDALEERGFEVADRSIANYNKTAQSLAASLNLMYLDEVAAEARRSGVDGDDWRPVYDLLRDHRVGRFLTDAGYRYVHLGSWWDPTATAATADVTYRYGSSTEFATVFEHTTPLPAVREVLGIAPEGRGIRGYLRDTNLYQLDKLEEVAARRSDQPRFVFAHLTLPHHPYVFDVDGSWVSYEEEVSRTLGENFVAQLQYTNRRLLRVVDLLLDRPEDEHPIIVIQSDEALHPLRYRLDDERFVWPEATDAELLEKFRILNAYYLPGLDDPPVYEDITPVNTFRLILDRYFGTDHGLLPDRAYVIHSHQRLHEFTEVTDRIRDADPIPPGFGP